MSDATGSHDDDLDSDSEQDDLPVRYSHGRRQSDSLLRNIQKYWAILSFLLTMGLGLLVYIHSSDMSRVQNLEAGDALLSQQRAVNLQRLAIVEERTARLEKLMEGQDEKLDQILKAVQWQAETSNHRQRAQRAEQ